MVKEARQIFPQNREKTVWVPMISSYISVGCGFPGFAPTSWRYFGRFHQLPVETRHFFIPAPLPLPLAATSTRCRARRAP